MSEWAGPHGTRWLWEAPPARDVVHLVGQILPLAGGEGWRQLARWLAARVIGVEGVEIDGQPADWERLTRAEQVRLVEQLDAAQLDQWAAHVLTTIALPAELLDQVRELARVAASGGCECRRCKGGDMRGPLKSCLYAGVGAEAERRVQVWWPLREADLSGAPWWMWQLGEAWELGRAAALAEARRQADQRREMDELLKKRGKL